MEKKDKNNPLLKVYIKQAKFKKFKIQNISKLNLKLI